MNILAAIIKAFFFIKTEMFFPVQIQKTNHKISQNISGLQQQPTGYY